MQSSIYLYLFFIALHKTKISPRTLGLITQSQVQALCWPV